MATGGTRDMPDTRLIERWLPIAALGVESTRERTPMTPFPRSEPPPRLVGAASVGSVAGGRAGIAASSRC